MINANQKELVIPYFILFIVMVVSIYPILYMISTSLMTSAEAANQYLFPKKLMFGNYAEVWTSNNFQKYTMNSLIISTLIVSGVLFTSIPAAYAFAKIRFPFRDIIFYSLLLSLMIPEIILITDVDAHSPQTGSFISEKLLFRTENLLSQSLHLYS